MSQYAAATTVSSEKSRNEIERTLTRYGADGFMYGWADGQAQIMFRLNARHIRFILPLPERAAFKLTPTGKLRTADAIETAFEQAFRQRWRALALVIKAKLEAVESGITEFDDEFLANIVLPDNRTVGQFMRPQIALAYEQGQMPKLLPSPDKPGAHGGIDG